MSTVDGMRKGEGKRKRNIYQYIAYSFFLFNQLLVKGKKIAGYPVCRPTGYPVPVSGKISIRCIPK